MTSQQDMQKFQITEFFIKKGCIGSLTAGCYCLQYASDSKYFAHTFYEGWNFNSGNYLFTTDTK